MIISQEIIKNTFMNRFAYELDKIIKKRQLSNVKAGKLLNIDPSLLRRYRKGERIPRNDTLLQQLNEGLDLSITEQNDIAYAYKVTKSPIRNNRITVDEILTSLDQNMDPLDSSILSIKEYICKENDFTNFDHQKMIGIHSMEQIQNALSYIGTYAKEHEAKIYVLSELLRKKDKLSPVIRFKVPELRDTEQVIITNHFMEKYDLLISYIQHIGISNDTADHSIYLYKTNCSLNISDSWMFLSDQFVLKYEIYADSVSGFLSFDPDAIQYHKDIYDRYRENSSKHVENLKNIFLELINKAR